MRFLKDNKKIILFILVPICVGFVGYLLGGNTKIYTEINRPLFAPPGFIFPIVWTILYILIGTSIFIISNSEKDEKLNKKAMFVYYAQLIVNGLWSLFFFRLKWFLFSFIWIILLLILVIYMTILFSKINKKSAYLNIPYIIWLLFASLLCYSVFYLNI